MIGDGKASTHPADLLLKDPLPTDKSSIGSQTRTANTLGHAALTQAREADSSALDTATIYARWARFVWVSLQRLGVRSADLDDICHDVFIVVQRKLPEFDRRGKVQTWLLGICVRVAANYRRRAYIRLEQSAGDLHADGAVPIAAPEGARPDHEIARRRLLHQAEARLNLMSPIKRTVFVMFELEGLSCVEIAEELGLPVGTVYSRLHAARKVFLAKSQHKIPSGKEERG